MSYKNRDWLYLKYVTEELSLGDIAAEIGVCPQTISYWLKKYGIPTRTVSEASWTPSFLKKARPRIDVSFRNRGWLFQKYIIEERSLAAISQECRVPLRTIAAWLKYFAIPIRDYSSSQQTENCRKIKSEKLSKERSARWNGGRKIACGGYILLARKDHPHADSCGYVMEHRLVMESLLGRYLNPSEVVHHIDGNVTNNSPENLMLFQSPRDHRIHHAGMLREGVIDVEIYLGE
ncbi:MAG: HNH endonuclease [Candidatus Omnitrophota bacterium]|jgi:hypothetical protein